MEAIRDNFIDKITTSARQAIGLSAVFINTIGSYEQSVYENGYLDQTVHLRIASSEGDTREIEFSPTNKEIIQTIQSNPTILCELYLTQIVQHWFDFLQSIYDETIQENLLNGKQYPISNTKMKVDLSKYGSDLTNSIINQASIDFSFLQATEKLKEIKKILKKDLSAVSEDINLLKINIEIRNTLQHNNGFLTEKVLSDLGLEGSSIREDYGLFYKYKKANDQITRTPFDIENLVKSLKKIAYEMIPKS